MKNDTLSTSPVMDMVKPGYLAITNLLNEDNIRKILAIALARGGEFAEIYAEYAIVNGLSLEERKIRQAQSGISQGIGIRVINGEQTGYAYSESLDFESVSRAARTASTIANHGFSDFNNTLSFNVTEHGNNSPVKIYPDQVETSRKADYLWRANEAGYSQDKRITHVEASIWDAAKVVFIANSEGYCATDQRIMLKLNVGVLAQQNGGRLAGRHGGVGCNAPVAVKAVMLDLSC